MTDQPTPTPETDACLSAPNPHSNPLLIVQFERKRVVELAKTLERQRDDAIAKLAAVTRERDEARTLSDEQSKLCDELSSDAAELRATIEALRRENKCDRESCEHYAFHLNRLNTVILPNYVGTEELIDRVLSQLTAQCAATAKAKEQSEGLRHHRNALNLERDEALAEVATWKQRVYEGSGQILALIDERNQALAEVARLGAVAGVGTDTSQSKQA